MNPVVLCDSHVEPVWQRQQRPRKACKNMRVLYLLRSGSLCRWQSNLSPTSISPFREFLNQGFVFRNRATYGSLVEIGLKRQTNPEGKDYSVATFKRLVTSTVTSLLLCAVRLGLP